MYVRVRGDKYYYQSMVYCIIGSVYGGRYVVMDPETDRFELVDYRCEDDEWPRVQIIDRDDGEEWVSYENAYLLKYKAYCRANGKEMNIERLFGYKDVCENYAFISGILEKKSLPVSEAGIELRKRKNLTDWKYIETQQDADEFMEMFAGFHDSTLETMKYTEKYASSEIRAVFDNSGWYGIVELCFEGVQAVKIRPPRLNYSRDIFDATLIVKDASVFWADEYMEEEDLEYEGSWIKALSLKWRRIDE